tara:strand:- start:169 stop:483 length:315 start_codon:yes stop_codon:yes gene_type:complete
MEFDNIKDFQIMDIQGKSILYKKGDIVNKDGKSYIATRDTRGYSPEHGKRGGWKQVNKNRIAKFSYDNDAPELPKEGDEWYDSSNGILFKYITNEDGNGQWVEI